MERRKGVEGIGLGRSGRGIQNQECGDRSRGESDERREAQVIADQRASAEWQGHVQQKSDGDTLPNKVEQRPTERRDDGWWKRVDCADHFVFSSYSSSMRRIS